MSAAHRAHYMVVCLNTRLVPHLVLDFLVRTRFGHRFVHKVWQPSAHQVCKACAEGGVAHKVAHKHAQGAHKVAHKVLQKPRAQGQPSLVQDLGAHKVTTGVVPAELRTRLHKVPRDTSWGQRRAQTTIYIYIYICIYTYICVYIYIHRSLSISLSLYIYIYICIYICIYVYIYIYVCIYIYIYI